MYEIQKDQSVPVKFFAGEYPVVTAVKAVAAGKSVKQYEPVKLTDNGIEPVVKVAASEAVSGTSTPAKSEYENTTAGIYGIAATAAEATEEIVVYRRLSDGRIFRGRYHLAGGRDRRYAGKGVPQYRNLFEVKERRENGYRNNYLHPAHAG